jgi:FkbM family methyltransferase
MRFIKNFLLKILGEKNYLFFIASMYQLLYKTGQLGKGYEDVYFLKKIIHPGNYVADIGAHLGYYTFELSRLVSTNGSVIAIEPVSKFYSVIEKIIRRKKNSNIHLHRVALGGNSEFVEIGIPWVGKQKKYGYARIKEMNEYLDYAETERVPNIKGDDLFIDLPRLDYIKCDVEGAEVPVFKSLLQTVKKYSPMVLCELSDKLERIKMYEMLLPFDYKACLLNKGKLHQLDVYGDELTATSNHYFIPESRAEQIKHLMG